MAELETSGSIALETTERPASETVPERELPREVVDEPVSTEADNDDEPSPEVPEFISVERNGKTYQVPKELEGEFSMQADYTKKTQTVAERAKELDAREAAIGQQSKASEDELNARVKILDTESKLKPYEGLDWVRFAAEDPVGAQQHRFYYDQLRQDKEAATKTIAESEQRRTQESQQTIAKRFEEAKAFAQKNIPGWSEETNVKLSSFAKDQGIAPEFLRDNMSPTLVKTLHLAMIGAELMKKQAAAPKAAAAEPIEPLAQVSSKSSAPTRVSLAQLAKEGRMDEYAAARRAGRTR